MKKPDTPIPNFQTEQDERAFWETHDSVGSIDWGEAVPVRLTNLKPSPDLTGSEAPTVIASEAKQSKKA